MILIQIVKDCKVRRSFIINVNDDREARTILQNVNKHEIARGEKPLYTNEKVMSVPIEFECQIFEV